MLIFSDANPRFACELTTCRILLYIRNTEVSSLDDLFSVWD